MTFLGFSPDYLEDSNSPRSCRLWHVKDPWIYPGKIWILSGVEYPPWPISPSGSPPVRGVSDQGRWRMLSALPPPPFNEGLIVWVTVEIEDPEKIPKLNRTLESRGCIN